MTIGRARVLVNGKVIDKAPKSERGYRTLPLDDVLAAALRALHTRQAAERLAAGQAYQGSGYVVADELGPPVHPEWFSDEFHRLAAAAGVPRIRLHDGQAHRQLAAGRRGRARPHPGRLVRPHRGRERRHLHPRPARGPGRRAATALGKHSAIPCDKYVTQTGPASALRGR